MRGTGELPISGGLFLGDEATALLTSTDRFPVSQDQRHTVRGRVSYQVTPAAWVACAASYGSGLPVEFAGDRAQAVAQYGTRIIDRVDFGAGRVRSSFSLDASAGLVLAKTNTRDLRLQLDVRNLTDRLNVINFAGLFSGTRSRHRAVWRCACEPNSDLRAPWCGASQYPGAEPPAPWSEAAKHPGAKPRTSTLVRSHPFHRPDGSRNSTLLLRYGENPAPQSTDWTSMSIRSPSTRTIT